MFLARVSPSDQRIRVAFAHIGVNCGWRGPPRYRLPKAGVSIRSWSERIPAAFKRNFHDRAGIYNHLCPFFRLPPLYCSWRITNDERRAGTSLLTEPLALSNWLRTLSMVSRNLPLDMATGLPDLESAGKLLYPGFSCPFSPTASVILCGIFVRELTISSMGSHKRKCALLRGING